MENKFRFELGKIKYGWCSIGLFNNDELLIGMSGTGVYNPFYEFPNIFKTIIEGKNYSWIVDQEGYDGLVKFTPKGDNIVITTEDLRNKPKFQKTITTFKKQDVLDELYREISRWYPENENEIHNNFAYDFWFNINEVNSLYEKGFYLDELITREILKYKNDIIISEYNTEDQKLIYILNNKKRSYSLQELLKETTLFNEMKSLNQYENLNEIYPKFEEMIKSKNIEKMDGYCEDELLHSFY